MKPTLVTGANGHLGNNLCRLLVARGEPVRAMIRPSADPAPLAGLDLEIVRGDIVDPASTGRALEGCGRLYHTAAGFLMWSRDPERDIIRPSVEGTRNVFEAAASAWSTSRTWPAGPCSRWTRAAPGSATSSRARTSP